MKRYVVLVLMVLAATLIFNGCAEKITGEGHLVKIQAMTEFSAPGKISEISEFRVRIYLPGEEEPLEFPLELVGSYLMGEITVPAGPERTFVVEAMDNDFIVMYSGVVTVDVIAGEDVILDIDLLPVVPMLKFTPRYFDILMGEEISVDVSIFNSPDLSLLEFNIYYGSQSGTIYLDSIMRGLDLNPLAEVSWADSGTYATVWVSEIGDVPGLIVDDEGYAHLATVYFNSHWDTSFELDTAYLVLSPTRLVDTSQAMTVEDLYTDQAMVILTHPPEPIE